MSAHGFAARRFGLGFGLALVAFSVAIAGCNLDDDGTVFVPDVTPPAIPSGFHSITGDGEVRLVWNPNLEEDLAGYTVYWSEAPAGPYEFVANTTIPRYVDRDVDNGSTYYYAVTAVDEAGNESELSQEFVHDTPRPAGENLVLWNAAGASWELSGYDFDHYVRRPWTSVDADIFFLVDQGRRAMVAGGRRSGQERHRCRDETEPGEASVGHCPSHCPSHCLRHGHHFLTSSGFDLSIW